MLEDTSLLVWGIVFGAFGMGYFAYGKKQKAAVPLCAGIALFGLPYLISNVYLLVFAGVVVVVLPYFVRL